MILVPIQRDRCTKCRKKLKDAASEAHGIQLHEPAPGSRRELEVFEYCGNWFMIRVSSDRTAGIYFGELKMMKKRALTLVVLLAFWFLPTPAPAAPALAGHQRPATGEEFVERVLTWLRQRLPEAPKPQKVPTASPKCGGTLDPDGQCRP